MLMFQVMSNMMTISLPYFCNWVLGTYNDGTTQMILSAVGKAPLGFGVFLLWPLVKKFGKRKVMIVGFTMAAIAEAICLAGSTSMPVMLAGSLIYAIGWLPSYVFSALMADPAENADILQTLLREEWGLGSMIMTDWGTYDTVDPVQMVKAGNCWLTDGGGKYVKILQKAVKEGKLSRAVLEHNVRYVIKTILRWG